MAVSLERDLKLAGAVYAYSPASEGQHRTGCRRGRPPRGLRASEWELWAWGHVEAAHSVSLGDLGQLGLALQSPSVSL